MKEGEPIRACDVRFLPIVSAYARTLGVVEEFDRLCGSKRGVSDGQIVLALVLDALSGRSPLFRLPEAFAKLDTELLLGEGISPERLNDDAVGRALDRIFEVGTGKVLSAVALRAEKLFDLDTTHVHHDTTSRTVYGDYDLYGEETHDQPFVITFGFSKDHRPDLKQLVHSLLCVDAGIPIYSRCENGNESDKVVNRNLIPKMVERMAELGTLSEERSTPKRKPAHYHGLETMVDLYGVWYRGLVVHSDAYDERRVKKLERTLEQDRAEMGRIASEQEKVEYACLPDAQAAISRLPKGRFHELVGRIEEKPIYTTGRPKADGTRKIQRTTYRLKISLQPREKAIARARKEAGCFVLITNEPDEAVGGLSSKELLRAYQDQHSVEQNFGFLKDPVIVNALFLKSPRRIEALGLILVLALMIWRLMERTMRVSLKESNSKVVGWNNRQNSRPTSFMMTTKFVSVIVIRTAERRFLAEPLDRTQERYLQILGLSKAVFTNPSVSVRPHGGSRMQPRRGTG